ncbi:hypothetical protein PC116_g24340 [Phytophthora cactorum]|nr:hypothetical protein PC119_g21518 [Phytophthora cactorum]KAG4227263.1 hypothetical protein PC116_g24340 [Phytophthora cactorum]
MRTLIDAGRASFFGGWRRRSIAELRGVAVTASYGLFSLLVSVSILFTVSVGWPAGSFLSLATWFRTRKSGQGHREGD